MAGTWGGTGLYGTSAQQNAQRTMGRGDDLIDSDIRPTHILLAKAFTGLTPHHPAMYCERTNG